MFINNIFTIIKEFTLSSIKLKLTKVSGTILFFGSARIKSEKEIKELSTNANNKEQIKHLLTASKHYEDTFNISYEVSKWLKEQKIDNKYLVATGGGPGIMEAANKGAFKANAKSIGFNIKLPFEQKSNKYITSGLSFNYKYFFFRKYFMLKTAKIIVICPGGYGTLDELFELLTLLQTGKIKHSIPIIVYNKEFYKTLISFVKELAKHELISKEDISIFKVVNNKEEAITEIKNAINNQNA